MNSVLKKTAWAVAAALGLGATAAHAVIQVMPKKVSFNGDANADLIWQNTNGTIAMWLMNGNQPMDANQVAQPAPGAVIVQAGDFGGDGKGDLLWRDPQGGYWLVEMDGLVPMSTHNIFPAAQNPGGDWSVVAKADFNADNRVDLVWRRASDGAYGAWIMNGSLLTQFAFIDPPEAGFEIAAIADFNGDGKDDILWQHADGRVYVQLITSITTSGGVVGTFTAEPAMVGYTPILGDFNGDRQADIVWKNGANDHIMWLMNGATVSRSTEILPGGSTWSVIFARDLDADGKTDLVWRNSADGNTGQWIMNGDSVHAYGHLVDPNFGWTVKYMADLNGDGKTDAIVVNDTDGSVATWLVAGGVAYSYALVSGPNTGWSVNYLP